MIEELRKQNQAALEKQKSNIRDEILQELKPLLEQPPPIKSGFEISMRSERVVPPQPRSLLLDPEQSKPERKPRRRQRPKSPNKGVCFLVFLVFVFFSCVSSFLVAHVSIFQFFFKTTTTIINTQMSKVLS
jgi:hypothetical protein